MILTTEYLILIMFSIMLIFAVGAIVMTNALERAKAPKVSVEMIKMTVVRKPTGIFFEFIVQSHSTAKVCINYIDFVDLGTKLNVTVGDHDPGEASDLPICIDPGFTFTLGGYQAVDSGFLPGSKVMVVIHYSIGSPNTIYRSNDPNTMIFFTRMLS